MTPACRSQARVSIYAPHRAGAISAILDLTTVMTRAGTRRVSGAIAMAIPVCFCFNSTVYLAYMSAGEKPQLQLFIAVYDQVSFALTAVVIHLVTRRSRGTAPMAL